MQFKKSLLTATLLTVAGLAAVSSANAAEPGSFDVNMKVMASCTVTADDTQNIDFDDATAGILATVDLSATASTGIQVVCSKDAPYTVRLTPSNLDTTGKGVMTGPLDATSTVGSGETIAYQLIKPDGSIWGNTDLNGVSDFGNGLSGTVQSHVVAAKVTTLNDVRPGNYTDNVAVNITY